MRNQFGSTVLSQYDYAYDTIGRRENVRNSGSAFAAAAFTRWGYDERNQVTASNRYLGSNVNVTTSPVTAEARAFGYDPIGNRETSTAGGTTTSYAANELNQYESVGSEEPAYDEDGNLLDDGTKVLAYNAENQLVRVEVPGVSVSTYDYDYIGRRVRKSVDLVSGDDYSVTWAYSGWNKIEERKTVGSTTTVKNFVWGLDLSQSTQGAGGVGGLLASVDANGTNLFAYDGNGNVSELINASTGAVAAHYEYDAFGNSLLASGSAAAENPYRFSTKYLDGESGLYYYGYRYYDTTLGRWTQRDPIGELGGLNTYAFSRNRPSDRYDYLGLAVGIGSRAPIDTALTLARAGVGLMEQAPGGLPPDKLAIFAVKGGAVISMPTPRSCKECLAVPPGQPQYISEECLEEFSRAAEARGASLVAYVPGVDYKSRSLYEDLYAFAIGEGGEEGGSAAGHRDGTCRSGTCLEGDAAAAVAALVRLQELADRALLIKSMVVAAGTSIVGMVLKKSGDAIEGLVGDAIEGGASAANRASHEAYKSELRAAMERPSVSDQGLGDLLDELYRPGATVGSGSTAAAVRHELATGGAVGGRHHTQKAENYAVALQRWLANNPSARPGDRAAAENVLLDLQNALNGK